MKDNKKPKDLHKITGDMLDPTHDAQEIFGSEDNITGITQNRGSDRKKYDLKYPTKQGVAQGMSDAKTKQVESLAADPDDDMGVSQGSNQKTPQQDDIPGSGGTVFDEGNPLNPDDGEQSVSGDATSPEADDDTQKNAQDMGFDLAEDPDEEHPKPLDMGSDIDKAEEYHRKH